MQAVRGVLIKFILNYPNIYNIYKYIQYIHLYVNTRQIFIFSCTQFYILPYYFPIVYITSYYELSGFPIVLEVRNLTVD